MFARILISRHGASVLCLGHPWQIIMCPSHLGAHVWIRLHFYYSYIFQKSTHQAVCVDAVVIQSSFVFPVIFLCVPEAEPWPVALKAFGCIFSVSPDKFLVPGFMLLWWKRLAGRSYQQKHVGEHARITEVQESEGETDTSSRHNHQVVSLMTCFFQLSPGPKGPLASKNKATWNKACRT